MSKPEPYHPSGGRWRSSSPAARMLRKAAVPALGIAGVVALAGVGLPEWALTVGLLGVLYLLGLIDQVRWSLHPFYRRRLASAFAVRRVRTGGRVRAEPYDFDSETTDLATYGARPAGFPEVVFCCAAHVSGVLAPPGRRLRQQSPHVSQRQHLRSVVRCFPVRCLSLARAPHRGDYAGADAGACERRRSRFPEVG